jgi:hypothetical protein
MKHRVKRHVTGERTNTSCGEMLTENLFCKEGIARLHAGYNSWSKHKGFAVAFVQASRHNVSFGA